MIKQDMQAEQIVAMKAKDTVRLQTIRYILAQIKNKEIENQKELTEEEVIDILRKETKKLQEAATEFIKGGRPDLAEENEQQAQIIATYLPQELSDDELKKQIEQIIASNADLFRTNPNALIGICVSKLKSQASSSRIAQLVRSHS